jgi:hypothetical protein
MQDHAGVHLLAVGRRRGIEADQPRNSTRSPRASAAVIWSNIAVTSSSASSRGKGLSQLVRLCELNLQGRPARAVFLCPPAALG